MSGRAEHELPASVDLDRADAPFGRAAELRHQLRRLLGTRVSLALEECLQALLAQPARVRGARVALQERERDLAIQIAKQADRTGPEPLQLGAQMVAERHPGLDEILARVAAT